MSGSLAELVIPGGITELKCPITGIPLILQDEGFDSDAHHSPHLRFFVDWDEQAWVVDPSDLPDAQASEQERLVEILTGDHAPDALQERIDACVDALTGSALVLEIVDPPLGAFEGEVCYACYDLGARAPVESVRLHPVEGVEVGR